MTTRMLGGLLLMTAACTPVPPAEPAEDPIRELSPGGRTCNAAKAQPLVGRQGTSELGAEALRLSGAGTIRWIPLGSAVTMDYRTDRLNIELDDKGRVTEIRCG